MKYLISLLFLLTYTSSLAQINLQGQILDKDTKETLPILEIKISTQEKKFYSDLDGKYELVDVKKTDIVSFFI